MEAASGPFGTTEDSPPDAWIRAELDVLKAHSLDRHLRTLHGTGGVLSIEGRQWINLASNDYLDLANHPQVKKMAADFVQRHGVGATASRLVTGNLAIVEELEHRLAALKGFPAALVFGSGFLANAGIIPALVGRGDHIYADRLAHASLIDGCVLSRATLRRFRHNDMTHLGELLKKDTAPGRRLILTESVFSMDGDLAPLEGLITIAKQYGAMLLVDEAHATGVFGEGGAGRLSNLKSEHCQLLSMGTLSKALGGYGGYVATTELMRDFLINKARSFVFSTGLPPAVIGAALGSLDVMATQPDLGLKLLARADRFRQLLTSAGLDVGASESQIVPLMIGDSARALRVSARLNDAGILAVAIRPPTVPAGTARIRLSVTLAHSDECLRQAADAIIAAVRAEGLS